MSNAVAAKELGRLCYSDMREFAKWLLKSLADRTDKDVHITLDQMCDALATMQDMFNEADQTETDRLLRKVFSKGRVKNIHVEVNSGGGFTLTFRKQTVHGQRLSDAVNNLLDQIASLQAMGVDP